jgi:hypothetical protein
MTTYTRWEVHSITLHLETRVLDRIAEATTAFVADNGDAALNVLLLGIETEGDYTA